jgi:hypothetical protein
MRYLSVSGLHTGSFFGGLVLAARASGKSLPAQRVVSGSAVDASRNGLAQVASLCCDSQRHD